MIITFYFTKFEPCLYKKSLNALAMTLLSSTILPFITNVLLILPDFDFPMISFRICQVFLSLNLFFSSMFWYIIAHISFDNNWRFMLYIIVKYMTNRKMISDICI